MIADTNNIEFKNNMANNVSNAIYNSTSIDGGEMIGGIINLWASDSASVIFNDRITGDNTSILNINQSSGTLPTI